MAQELGTSLLVLALSLATISAHAAERAAPVYQRRSSVWHGGWHGGAGYEGHGYHPSQQQFTHPQGQQPRSHSRHSSKFQHQPTTYEQHSGSSFQRPYPYHLDYYRMKYGGSYAPYFGNLYGPPKVYAPTNVGGQPQGPYDHGAYPPPGEYHGPPTYGEPAPVYGQPVVVESAPAESSELVERGTVDPEPAAE